VVQFTYQGARYDLPTVATKVPFDSVTPDLSNLGVGYRNLLVPGNIVLQDAGAFKIDVYLPLTSFGRNTTNSDPMGIELAINVYDTNGVLIQDLMYIEVLQNAPVGGTNKCPVLGSTYIVTPTERCQISIETSLINPLGLTVRSGLITRLGLAVPTVTIAYNGPGAV
jgi:hypothetical protein